MKTVKKICIFIITVLFSLLLLKANTEFNTQAAAEGTGSDTTCTNASNKDINPNDSGSTTPFTYSFDAGAGKVVDGVCIKSGENMFGDSHSDLLGNGSYESGCYTISGVSTQTVTVTRNLSGSNCQALSHLDINVSISPTPTPTPTLTPSPTPTPPLTLTPTDTPNENKVSLCHATASYTNPYEFISVALSAADGGGDSGDHFNEHTGPIFDPLVNKSGDNWGDIIPPISGVHSGLNWTTEGQTLFRNECVSAAPTPTPTQSPTPTPTPTPGEPGRGGDGGSSSTTTTPSNPGTPGEVQEVQAANQPEGQLKGVLGLSTTSSGSKTNPYLAYVQLMGALYFSLEAYKRFIRTS